MNVLSFSTMDSFVQWHGGADCVVYHFTQAADRLVPRTRAEEWCIKAASGGGIGMPVTQSLPHYETSAKTAINVEEAFTHVATLAMAYEERKRKSQPQLFIPPTERIDLDAHRRQAAANQETCC
jgi:hypothetical protein